MPQCSVGSYHLQFQMSFCLTKHTVEYYISTAWKFSYNVHNSVYFTLINLFLAKGVKFADNILDSCVFEVLDTCL